MLESNSKIKYGGENFYFVDNLNDWNEFVGNYFFTGFQSISEEITNSNENYINQPIDVTNNVEELHEYLPN